MKTSWLIGLVMTYVILTVISGISEGTYFGGTGVATVWRCLTSFQTIESASLATVAIGVFIAIKDLFIGLFEILTWKFSFFTGVWIIFRWLFTAISVGIVVSLLLALRGTSSG